MNGINERILENLITELGEDFLKHGQDKMSLYGAKETVLSSFRKKMIAYLQQQGKNIPISFGQDGGYNIDVGFFLHAGYFKGINKDVSTLLQEA